MKEGPILFNGEMVRAVLEGRKTKTRRVIKPQPKKKLEHLAGAWFTHYWQSRGVWNDDGKVAKCPYGKGGDWLWVRETWGYPDADLRAPWNAEYVSFKADESTYCKNSEAPFAGSSCSGYVPPKKWRPSIFMPRWASRITLEITGVRVERVQDISHEDAKAEGAPVDPPLNNYGTGSIYRDWFAKLWDSINAKPRPIKSDGQIVAYECFSWDESHPICREKDWRGKPLTITPNPWVWVIEFQKVGK